MPNILNGLLELHYQKAEEPPDPDEERICSCLLLVETIETNVVRAPHL